MVTKLKKKNKAVFSAAILILFSVTVFNPIYAFDNSLTNSKEMSDFSRDSWWWEEAELVSVDSTDISVRVDSVMDDNNNLHVIWRDNTDYGGSGIDQDIFYKKYNANTQSWSTCEIVSSESDGDGNSPTIAIDELGNIHAAWIDATDINSAGTDVDIFYKMKETSTGIWSDVEVVSTGSSESSLRPDVAIDSLGNVHIVWHDNFNYDGADTDVLYKKRDATSETWSSPTIISTSSTGASYSAKIAVDNLDQLHVVWYDHSDNLYGSGSDTDVFYKKWDSGSFWSSGFTLSFESTQSSYYSTIFIDADNAIYVAWSDQTDIYDSGTDSDIFYTKWDPSSSSWATINVITPESTSSSTDVRITTDRYSNVHFVWTEYSNLIGAGIDADIFYRSFNEETNTLSDLTVITELSDDNSYFSSISKDSKEHLHVIWYDYTNDLLDSGSDADVFYKKFVGPPETPKLASFIPKTVLTGNYSLSWSPCIGADEYKVYRSNSYIWTHSDLELVATATDNYFTEDLSEVGVYYYVIIASNIYGDSDFSNVESIEVVEFQSSGLFDNINWGETLILGGFLGALQIVFAVVIVATKSASKPSSSSKKGKKK